MWPPPERRPTSREHPRFHLSSRTGRRRNSSGLCRRYGVNRGDEDAGSDSSAPTRSETVTQCASAIRATYPVRLSTSAVPTFIGSSEYSRLRLGIGGTVTCQHSDSSTGRMRKYRRPDWISLACRWPGSRALQNGSLRLLWIALQGRQPERQAETRARSVAFRQSRFAFCYLRQHLLALRDR